MFFDSDCDKNDDDKITSYFHKKIYGYKKQDEKGKRSYVYNMYVNVEWLDKCIGSKCGMCGCGFYCDVIDGNVDSNITAQRLNNKLSHTLDNIKPMCTYCNTSCSNR